MTAMTYDKISRQLRDVFVVALLVDLTLIASLFLPFPHWRNDV